MDPGIRQDFWAPAYRRGDAGFGDYGLLKFRCVYRAQYLHLDLNWESSIVLGSDAPLLHVAFPREKKMQQQRILIHQKTHFYFLFG